MIFTAIPLLVMAIFDEDFNYLSVCPEKGVLQEDLLIKSLLPFQYQIGPKQGLLNTRAFFLNFLESTLLIITFILLHYCIFYDDVLTVGS